MAAGTLYTYPENFRAYKALAAANYSGFNLTVDAGFLYGTTNRTPEFRAKFPLGKVPALETSTGVCLNESNAIAVYVANEQLVGKTGEDKAKVTQWMNFADQEILPAVCTWVFPCMGFMQYNKTNTERAKDEILAVMAVLDKAVASGYLVGNSITLADLSVTTYLLLAYEWVMDPAFRAPFPNVNKWFEKVVTQPQVKKALPEFKLCEKMAQFDAKKYAETSGGEKKKSGGEKKQQQPKKEVQAKKPAAAAPAAEDPPAEPKKSKNPFDAFPNSDKFIMDEWKKIYSNEDTETVAMPWFWDHFDAEKYSLWHGEYQYNDSLSAADFMNVNLIGGMIQRLDGMRKHAFGVGLYFNEPSKRLSGLYFCKGPTLPFSLSDDLNIDAESYEWTQLDFNDPKARKMITEYWMVEGEFEGAEPYDFKIFK